MKTLRETEKKALQKIPKRILKINNFRNKKMYICY